MTNFVQNGYVLNFTNGGTAIVGGSVVIVGNYIGVAPSDIAANVAGELALLGVYTLAKTNPLTISQGDKLYYNAGSGLITKTASDTPIGSAWLAAGSTAATVQVKLLGNAVDFDAANATVATFVAQIATANATDLATSEALANQCKASINSLLTSLINAGVMAAS